jgi:glycosyltransferase involved in cell wall biosynthesis
VLVGGSETSIHQMRDLARSVKAADICIFTGPRPSDELGAYLTMANILVSPRIRGTNTPLKIYDYMQSGRAIIATDLTTHRPVLDNSCALLIPPQAQALAEAIQGIVSDASLAAGLGAAAAKRLEESYSLPIFKRKVQAAYARLLVDAMRLSTFWYCLEPGIRHCRPSSTCSSRRFFARSKAKLPA